MKTLIKDFQHKLRDYAHLLDLNNEEVLISGMICYYGAIMVSLCEQHNVKYKQDLLDFTALYLLIDSYLDDKDIPKNGKLKLLATIDEYFKTGKEEEKKEDSSRLATIRSVLQRLCKRKEVKDIMLELYKAEKTSIFVQAQTSLGIKTYREMCFNKGGLTVQAIQVISGGKATKEGYQLGAIIQLLDDLSDVDLDLHDGINTEVTQYYSTNGSCDKLVYECAALINDLDKCYNIMKPFMIFMLTYATLKKNYYKSDFECPLKKRISFL